MRENLLGRFEQDFIEDRRRQLELWLNRICRHPVLCASFPVQHFLTCEITEKNNKVNRLTSFQKQTNSVVFSGLESRQTKSRKR